jgi:hypothetical protein
MAGPEEEEEKEEAEAKNLVLVMAGHGLQRTECFRTPMSRPSTVFDFALS